MAKPSNTRDTRPSDAMPSEPVPAGLVWVTDTQPGIRRLRHGEGFRYVDGSGRPVRDAQTLARIRRLAIPPAYESVWICADENGHLQATGRDARGRKQYRYHAVWQHERGVDKFDFLRTFGHVLSRIRARVRADLAAPPSSQPTRSRVLAAIVRLLDTTFLRIGNAEYARGNGSYGLTTLRCRHAGIDADEVRLSFEGKGGIRHEARLDDARVAAVVRRCRQLPGQELFQYRDTDGNTHKVTSADVNDYLAVAAGAHVTAKDFRTWHGSVLALEFARLACRGAPEFARPTAVIERVARQLGNTATVCRKSYVHPAVLELLASLPEAREGAALPTETRARRGATRGRLLSAAEKRLLALLDPGGSMSPTRAISSSVRRHSACLDPCEKSGNRLNERITHARDRAPSHPPHRTTTPLRTREGQARPGRTAARRDGGRR